MAKTKISQYDSTAGNNTDINNIDIAEGCAPSGINNAIREMMAQLKNFQTGAGGDGFAATQIDLLAQSALRFQDTTGGEYVAFRAPTTVATNVTWTLPSADGTANQFLKTDGSGVLSWDAFTQAYPSAGVAVSTGTAWGTSLTAPTGALVGISDTQTLTNKTIAFGSNTLTDVASTNTTQTLTNKTLTDPAMIGTILEDIFTITDGAAFEIDPGNGSIQLITLGDDRTPKATNFAAGEAVTLMVDDGSAYSITWTDATFGTGGVEWKTDGGNAPTLNTTGYTVITLWKVGTQIYGARVGDA